MGMGIREDSVPAVALGLDVVVAGLGELSCAGVVDSGMKGTDVVVEDAS
jgi:GTP-sensing pleiotropic transcriptional regulator CodY